MTSIDRPKVRDLALDGIKGLMLFLVAFGHVINCYKGNGAVEETLMKYIYLFHMPIFAFVTGHFSKNAQRAQRRALTGALLPYVIFQTLYIVSARMMMHYGLASFSAEIFRPSLLLPTSAFYYLLAVFFWKLALPDLMRLRHPLLVSLAMGLVVSLTEETAFHVALGPVFTLLPFFMLGVIVNDETIAHVRRMPLWLALAILAIGWPIAYYRPYSMHSIRFTYTACGMAPLTGLTYRALFYGIATIMMAAILRLFPSPRRPNALSTIGSGAILAYAGATFLSPHLYLLFADRLHLTANRVLNLVGMAVFSFTLVWICSRPPFMRTYSRLQNWLEHIFFKED